MLIVADNPLRDPRGLYRIRTVCLLMTGAGVTGAGVTGVTGAGVTGAGVTGAGVSGDGVTGAGVTGLAVGAPVGGLILHGGGLVSQLRPFASIFDGQHPAAPPGLVSHPASIHKPHDAEQH